MRMFLMAALFLPLFAQPRSISIANSSYERILCIVPMVGAGTWADPKRPMFIPASGLTQDWQAGAVNRTIPFPARRGIIAYQYQISDDGRFALVEFVATSRPAFTEILTSRAAGVQLFDRDKDSKASVIAAFKLLRKDFDFDKFSMPVR